MNSSQLLYKISNLQHSIRRKEAECDHAVKTKEEAAIQLHKDALVALKQELDTALKQFNSTPSGNADSLVKKSKKRSRWLSFFNIKAALNNK